MITVGQTIECPVCHTQNSYLAATCASCGAFIQDRVPKIDLFETAYRLLEHPRKTFLYIARSEQKNYVYTLYAFAGYALVAIIFVIAHVGNLNTNFIFTFAAFILVGPPIGIILLTLTSLVAWGMNILLWHTKISFRISSAFLAFSLVPIVFTIFFVLPIELAIFGNILFSNNPTPQFYKPEVFYLLASIDGIATLWTIFLFIRSFHSVYSISFIKILVTTIVSSAVIFASLYSSGRILEAIIF